MVKRAISFLAILFLLFTNSSVFAEDSFVDLDSNHWAYNYINKVVDLGLMDVYEDNTFRPEETLDTIDVLSYITRLFEVSHSYISLLRVKYEDELDEYNLSNEEKDIVAIALDNNLIEEDEILAIGNDSKKATKTEVSVYIAKAMGMKEKEAGKVFVFLYNDASEIPKDAMAYIDFLIHKGVLDQKGDGKGNFEPNEPITRAVLAKMLSEAYNEIKGISVIVVEDDGLVEDRGFIEAILIAQRPAIVIEREDETKVSYFLSEDVSITLDGKLIDIYGLRLGDFVNLEIMGQDIIAMEVETK